jgi:CheY-like chemotaxis protein
MRSRTVLLLEDDAVIAYDLRTTLSAAGFDVIGPYASAALAQEFLQHQMPDVVVVDVLLREDSALNLIDTLQKRRVPMVIVSGLSPPEDNRFAGAPWLAKPVSPADLLLAIERVLADAAAVKPGGAGGEPK